MNSRTVLWDLRSGHSHRILPCTCWVGTEGTTILLPSLCDSQDLLTAFSKKSQWWVDSAQPIVLSSHQTTIISLQRHIDKYITSHSLDFHDMPTEFEKKKRGQICQMMPVLSCWRPQKTPACVTTHLPQHPHYLFLSCRKVTRQLFWWPEQLVVRAPGCTWQVGVAVAALILTYWFIMCLYSLPLFTIQTGAHQCKGSHTAGTLLTADLGWVYTIMTCLFVHIWTDRKKNGERLSIFATYIK